jgi:hypothetical protein
MSEPMSAVEIEDVLSSIRRLVSEDLRPTQRLVSAALDKGASKLILTPALRIVSDDRGALPEPADGSDDSRDLRSVLQDIETGDEAVETAQIVPVFGSVRQHEQMERPSQQWQGQSEGFATDANFLATAMSRINGLASANDNVDAAGQSDRIETVVAAVGAAVGPEEWEPDGGEPAPQEKAWGDTVWNSADATGEVAQQGDDATLVFDAVDLELADEMTAEAVESVEFCDMAEADAEVEASAEVGLAVDDVQVEDNALAADMQTETVIAVAPEESAVDVAGQVTIVFEDAAALPDEKRGVGAIESRVDALDLEDTAGFLSEDLLRDIVRDMIRDELQGSLGERITRNVRKLVRAEINRALASRDFE